MIKEDELRDAAAAIIEAKIDELLEAFKKESGGDWNIKKVVPS